MKAIMNTSTICGLTAILAIQAHAIEAPVDDAPPPMISAGSSTSTTPQAVEIAAFLGVVSGEIPELLSAHLGIQPDEGILVKAVMPDGPAAKAGVHDHDIITHIDHQPIQTPDDLTRAVLAKQPGDQVQLALIQKGQSSTIEVTLGARPNQMAGLTRRPMGQLDRHGVPNEMAQRMRDMIDRSQGQFDMRAAPFGRLGLDTDMDRAMREMMERMQSMRNSMHGGMDDLDSGDLRMQQNATVRMLDDEGSIELESANGIRQLTVRNTDNEVVWSGPWTTEEDKIKAPADIRERAEKLHLDSTLDGSSLKFHFSPGR